MKKKQKNQKYIAVKNGKPPKFPLPKKDLKLETINNVIPKKGLKIGNNK